MAHTAVGQQRFVFCALRRGKVRAIQSGTRGGASPAPRKNKQTYAHPTTTNQKNEEGLTVAWRVGDHSSAVAVVVAPVVTLPEERAAEASGAVGAVLVGAEGAKLAGGRGHVVVRTLAAVVDVRADDAAVLALERRHAAALEVTDAERGRASRAGRDAGAVEQVPTVAAHPAAVTLGAAVAVVAAVVEAPAAGAGLGPGLNPPALARD